LLVKDKKIFTYQNIIILASVLPIIIFGFLTYNNSKKEDLENSFKQIQNVNKQKHKIVEKYFTNVKFDITTLSKTVSFFEEQGSLNILNIQRLQKKHLINYYNLVQNNVLSLAKKDIFQYVYSLKKRGKSVDKTYLSDMYIFKKDFGIKNVLFIDRDGNILYSSDEKGLENTNVDTLTKPFGDVFKKIKSIKYDGRESIFFIDFGYDRVSKSFKQFAISPFKDVNGFVAIEIDQKPIQNIIEHIKSLGGTAETYLTYKYKDKIFLASNRVVKTGNIGDVKDNIYVRQGFYKEGVAVKHGSTGAIELVGYMPIKIKNLTLSMQTTVAYIEVISPIIKDIDYFKQFMLDYNYNNILLVGSKGDIFYEVNKGDDFGTNLLTGKYSSTHLAKALKEVFKTKELYITDIDFYPILPNKLSQFALIPMLNKDDKVKTIIVLELKLNVLSKKLLNDNKIYKTIETYLVGEDRRLRTDTLLGRDKFNLLKSFKDDLLINTKGVKDAFINGNGFEVVEDYRGVKVLSSFSVFESKHFRWAVITEIDESEIASGLEGLKSDILLFVFISSLIALFVMIIITNEKKKYDKKLLHNATHDSLTQLPNRKFALEFLTYRLANLKRTKSKGAVLFIDLDRFKFINDSYGHKAGDRVLKEVALRLKKVLREDDLLARLGGDEFVLIVNDFRKIVNLDALCKKIIENISQPIEDEQRNYKVNLSIGIAIFPNDSDNPSELLQFADTAMFKTKEHGRNGYTYYDKYMTKESLKIFNVERELKRAIENDELTLYYQPQINIKTDTILGVEALVRWNHPEKGLVMPDYFIPIAEDSHLIVELGAWVTKKACQDFKRWKEKGYGLEYVAVNMSAKQIQCQDCISELKKMLISLDFKPEWLELEITENVLIYDLENTLININSIREMGINLSIDDFGTGYSSLSYLKSLPIATLKIDREFIKDILVDKDDLAIVSAIIAMGHRLEYNIIAEGVEDIETVKLLKELECDMIQGYYYSKPICEEDLLLFFDEKIKGGGA